MLFVVVMYCSHVVCCCDVLCLIYITMMLLVVLFSLFFPFLLQYSLVVANIITYQLLLQPRATIDNAVHKSLLNFLVLVEDVNQVMILEFIEVFREALHTPATPTFQLPTNPPTIEFMFNLLREATSNKVGVVVRRDS